MNATWRCAPRGKSFSQVLRTVTLSCKYTRALTYEIFFCCVGAPSATLCMASNSSEARKSKYMRV